jgi:hypothetical protein
MCRPLVAHLVIRERIIKLRKRVIVMKTRQVTRATECLDYSRLVFFNVLSWARETDVGGAQESHLGTLLLVDPIKGERLIELRHLPDVLLRNVKSAEAGRLPSAARE